MANTQPTEKKQSAKQKKILVASILLAATITAGSTFAWFTSKDEVTNRLSASAEYGVAIAESFQPPENWVPGQEINKDASAVNTGNVDAFVRMWLTGSMRLLQQNKDSSTPITKAQFSSSGFTAPTTPVTDVNLLNANLTYQDTDGNYYRTLDKTQTQNPNSSISTNNSGYAGNENLNNATTGPYSEVQAMQSGILAYAPSGAKYSYVLDEETELEIYVTSDINGISNTEYKKVQVPAGTLVIVGADSSALHPATLENGILKPDETPVTITSTSGATKPYTSTVYVQAQSSPSTNGFIPQNVEYESFTPMTKGLYLFLRNESNAAQTEPEFSGYYMDKDVSSTNATATANATVYDNVNFFALNTNTSTTITNKSDYTVKGASTGTFDKATPIKVTYDDAGTAQNNITKVEPQDVLELFTATYETIDNTKLNFYADSTANKIYAIYDKADNTSFDENSDIAVEINLANVGTDAEQWTSIGGNTTATYTGITGLTNVYDATNLTFYYNNDVEAGDSTAKLVDTVKLYDGVTNKAYLAFDFDLNVNLESIQVTFGENGEERDTPVNPNWAATTNNNVTAAKGERDTGSNATKEIESITWQATTNTNPNP